METGTIFSIEEFAINDGPGIRTTVFLKGCPLRCKWCHNPEGLDPRPQTITRKDPSEPSGFREDISGVTYTSDQLASRLLKDREYLAMVGGGVTFTGGEPTMQSRFLLEVLDKIPGMHRAMETSGYCRPEVFAALLGKLDYVLMDIKMVDDDLHRKWTGVPNAIIQENLKTLKESGKPFVIRIPLIPGVNDSVENMQATASLLAGCKSLQRVELLRYHKTAGAKYSSVGLEYDPGFDTEAEPVINDTFTMHKIKHIIL